MNEAGYAEYRRALVIPMTNPKERKDIDTTLAQTIIDNELEYVLKYALDGLVKLDRRKDFDYDFQRHGKWLYNLLENPMKTFASKYITEQSWSEECKSDVVKQYNAWADHWRCSHITKDQFILDMRKAGCLFGEDCILTLNSKPTHVFKGFIVNTKELEKDIGVKFDKNFDVVPNEKKELQPEKRIDEI
jgi:hypothetical protein